MFKSTLALGAICMTVGAGRVPFVPQLKEESMVLEYTATSREAVIKVSAESESSLQRVEMCFPDGSVAVTMESEQGRALAISGFNFEFAEADLTTVLAAYGEGTYDFRARTVQGHSALGRAVLSHGLLPAPVVTWPRPGDAHVPMDGFTVRWLPDAAAAGYRVVVEQNDKDGLTVDLPPGTHSFRVPDGVLKEGTRTMVEVGVVGENGNSTLVEILCRLE